MLSQKLLLQLNQASQNPQVLQAIVYNTETDEGLIYNRRVNTLDCVCPFCLGDTLIRLENHINITPFMHIPNPFAPSISKSELDKLRDDMGKYTELLNLNLVQQIRAICLAMNITPEEFYKHFTDFKALDEFHVKLSEVERKANAETPEAKT